MHESFWINYDGSKGFGVRKHYLSKSKNDEFITSFIYIYILEGMLARSR